MICVDYNEGEPETYKGIYVFGCDDEKSKSYTGDPVKYMNEILKFLTKSHPKESIPFSSTADNFLMDSDGKYSYKYKNDSVVGLKKTPK